MNAKPSQSTIGSTGTQRRLVFSSVVVLARDVNQSIFKPTWLVANGILLEAEASAENAVYVPGLTQVPTKDFEFLVLPDRLQLQFQSPATNAESTITRVLGGITRTLSHTPFSAVGINYQYEILLDDKIDFYTWNRRTFASPWALSSTNNSPANRYGCTFAYDAYEGARMRIRAAVAARGTKDGTTHADKPPQYGINIHCNLHRDLPTTSDIKELTRMLSLWKRGFDDTATMIENLPT